MTVHEPAAHAELSPVGPRAETVASASPGTAPAVPVIVVASPARRRQRGSWGRLLQWVLLIALATGAFIKGVELRTWYFIASAGGQGVPSVRFTGDINNAFNQGSAVYRAAVSAVQAQTAQGEPRTVPTLGEVLRAYQQRYDIVAHHAEARNPGTSHYGLDYPPARLLTMTLWVRHVMAQRPGARGWVDDDLWPLLHFNTFMGALGAVGVFALVRYWGMRAAAYRGAGVIDVGFIQPAVGRSAWLRALAWMWGWLRAVARGVRGAWDGLWAPFIAACLFWFNAALLSNAHTWPQWDVWLLPGYIWAAYFASRGWWMSAGVSIAAACMFKGQLLIVAPVLLLWPLFQGRWMAVLRALVGFGAAMAVMAAAWLYGGRGHGWWLAGMVAAMALVAGRVAWRSWRSRRARRNGADALITAPEHTAAEPADTADVDADETELAADSEPDAPASAGRSRVAARVLRWLLHHSAGGAVLAMAVGLAAWPWGSRADAWRVGAYLGLLAVLVLPLIYGRNFRWGVWAAALIGAVLLLGPVLYEGSYAWARVGFVGPTDNHRGMHIGSTFNLPAILSDRYGWRLDDRPVAYLARKHDWPLEQLPAWAVRMTMQSWTRVVYFVLLGLTAAGLALHSARPSRAVLVALAAPWLIMFAVLAQMHERYLTYAAAISAIVVGYHWGFVLLHLVITVFATALLHTPGRNAARWPEWHEVIRGAIPGASWAVLLLAALFLWVAIVPPRRRRDLDALP